MNDRVEYRQGGCKAEEARPRYDFAQCWSINIFDHQIRNVLDQVSVVHNGQRGVPNCGGRAAFGEEPLEPGVVGPGDCIQEKLHGYVPVQHPVPTQINHTHPAAADLANEPYRTQLARNGDVARGRA